MPNTEDTNTLESPEYLRMSLAAAMTLGLKPGRFYRNAKLYCINLLLTYRGGCAARCAYCGLSNKRKEPYSTKSFIRVAWPTHSLSEIISRISDRRQRIKRICISQITNRRSIQDIKDICARLRSSFDIPVSLLISPTILSNTDLKDFRDAGADKIGVAIDLATPELFDQFRGKGVGGPHHWDTYRRCLLDAIEIFGKRNAGSHFVTGMGETEKEMVKAIQDIQDAGGWTHLFSFFPEADSQMKDHPMPHMDHYRRVQLARYLMDEGISRAEQMTFETWGRIRDFGLSQDKLDRIVDSGEPFRTSGCQGYDGEVACNRPYANSRPGPDVRNFPFPPNGEDIRRIRRQMGMAES
ncbi:radical SAM domain protein [delta proteobacterium NaphS2]|nr:radical SAM domain protein [delta proteobacterium NaphS2]